MNRTRAGTRLSRTEAFILMLQDKIEVAERTKSNLADSTPSQTPAPLDQPIPEALVTEPPESTSISTQTQTDNTTQTDPIEEVTTKFNMNREQFNHSMQRLTRVLCLLFAFVDKPLRESNWDTSRILDKFVDIMGISLDDFYRLNTGLPFPSRPL